MKEPNFSCISVLILLICSVPYIRGEHHRDLDEVQENYIIAYFKDSVTYEKGFIDSKDERKYVDHLKIGDSIFGRDQNTKIEPNSKVEIHFTSEIESLEDFFNSDYDAITKQLISVDLSHFKMTKLKTFKAFLKSCTSLTTFIGPKKIANELTEIAAMFLQCTSLKLIDFSNINFQNVNLVNELFSSTNFKYLNLKKSTYSQSIKNEIDKYIEGKSDMIICGGKKNFNAKDICCNYDIEKDECGDDSNYISAYYDIEEQAHKFSLSCEECFDNIGYLKIGGSILCKYDTFDITKNTKIEIHFVETLLNLSNFFNGEEKMISVDLSTLKSSKIIDMSFLFNGTNSLETIDFSNIDTSLVTNMNYMFSECSSLNSLNISNFDTSKVTNLEKMFYNCKNIKELSLSNFNTPLVTNMNQMFAGCSSLSSLDISNLDMKNCNNFENMFSDISTIKYLNLFKFKNDKIISTLFKEAKDIIICQSEKIVTSPSAIYCCGYDFKNNICLEPVPTNIPFPNKIPTSIANKIPTESPIAITTYIKNNIKTTIPSKINEISKSTTIIDDDDDNSFLIVLIGFSGFRNLFTMILFYIYFYCSNTLFYSKSVKFHIIIISNRALRALEIYDANCEIDENKNKNINTYFCRVDAQVEDIKNVKIVDINQFEFSGFNNTLSSKSYDVKASPLSEIFINNIQNVPDEFDALKNSTFYVLEHCKINKKENLYFNIKGIIDQKPKFGKTSFKLASYSKTQNETTEDEINCEIIDIINFNYTLNCKGNTGKLYNLQNALSLIDDEILLINFDNNDNSTINFEMSEKYYFVNRSKKGKINAGNIVAIIIPILFVIAITIITIICLRRRRKPIRSEDNSTATNLKH